MPQEQFQRFLGIRASPDGELVPLSLGTRAGEILDASLVLDVQRTGIGESSAATTRTDNQPKLSVLELNKGIIIHCCR